MKRLLTALVCIPIALLAVFRLPGGWFLLGVVALLELAVLEYIKIGEHWAPGGVLRSLLVLVPVTTFLLAGGLVPSDLGGLESAFVWLALLLMTVGSGTLAISARAPIEQGAASVGLLAFGMPYFALIARLSAGCNALTSRLAVISTTVLAPMPSTPPARSVRVWRITASGPSACLTFSRASAIELP